MRKQYHQKVWGIIGSIAVSAEGFCTITCRKKWLDDAINSVASEAYADGARAASRRAARIVREWKKHDQPSSTIYDSIVSEILAAPKRGK